MKKKEQISKKTLVLWSAIIVDLVILDQVLKYFVDKGRPDIELLSWFKILYAENYGIAFSLPVAGILTILLTFIVLYTLARWWKQTGWNIPFTLLFAGAVGNLIDRIFRGYVIDYISVGSFPIFNLADICITFGVMGLLWCEWRREVS